MHDINDMTNSVHSMDIVHIFPYPSKVITI